MISVMAREQMFIGSRGDAVAGAAEEEDLLAIEERTIENDEMTARSQYRRSPGVEEEKKYKGSNEVPARAESVEVAVKAIEEVTRGQQEAAQRVAKDRKIDFSIDKISGQLRQLEVRLHEYQSNLER